MDFSEEDGPEEMGRAGEFRRSPAPSFSFWLRPRRAKAIPFREALLSAGPPVSKALRKHDSDLPNRVKMIHSRQKGSRVEIQRKAKRKALNRKWMPVFRIPLEPQPK